MLDASANIYLRQRLNYALGKCSSAVRCPFYDRVEMRSNQAYFLTAFSMAPPALARSSGIMTG
jgi:hypothetical protein